MSKEKHGIVGGIIKVLMVAIFTAVGICLVAGNIYLLVVRGSDAQLASKLPLWFPIINLVFGCILLLSPFFLSHRREGANTVIRFIIVFIFVVIGAALIAIGACALGLGWNAPQWISICNIVFGSLLFTSPFFLRKDL